MTTILITAPKLADEAMQMLGQREFRVETMPLTASPAEMAERAASVDPVGIISRSVVINAEAIAAAKSLRFISKHGVGVDNIDMDAANARGIPVAFTLGANTQSVAEHAIALILSLVRKLPYFDRTMHEGRWERTSALGVELSGRSLGLVGYGAIGRIVGRVAQAIGMQVHVFDPFMPASADLGAITRHETLESLLAQADLISLHCPLTADTRHLIGTQAFAQMKPGAMLINTARGPIIDEAALVTALEAKKIGGAALDTFGEEPLSPQSRLRALDNVVLSPHVAASTTDAARRMSVEAVRNLLNFLDGKPVERAKFANPAVLDKQKAG